MRIRITIATALITLCLPLLNATAQDEGGSNFVPAELWVCNYRDGKDQGDFADALDDLKEWYEQNTQEAYAAWQLSPVFRGAEQDFDTLYLGAWPNGSTMGRSYNSYMQSAGDVDEAWEEAVECDASVMFASMMIHAPEDDGDDGNFVLTVSDCEVAKNRSVEQAIQAISAFSDYRVANGSTGGTFVWFPAFGGGGAEFDFKLVNGFSDWAALGAYFEWYGDGGGFRRADSLMDGLVDCDESRVYNGTTIVDTWPDD